MINDIRGDYSNKFELNVQEVSSMPEIGQNIFQFKTAFKLQLIPVCLNYYCLFMKLKELKLIQINDNVI